MRNSFGYRQRMEWTIDATYAGILDDSQVLALAEGTAITAANRDSRTLRVTLTASGTFTDACRALAEHSVLSVLVEQGELAGPYRVLAETLESAEHLRELLGARDVAARLGVSPARVRQLRSRPDWPRAVMRLPSGEELHSPAAIDAFNAGWDRTAGRPRKKT
jgi:hypothetical protein